MKTCIYFAESAGFSGRDGAVPRQEGPAEALRLAVGYGFTPQGGWRGLPLPTGAAGLMLDDRWLPDRRGLAAAAEALAAWTAPIVLDFERPPSASASGLIAALAGKTLILPAAYAAQPHAALLAGPWRGGGLLPWLDRTCRRWGAIWLDALPLRYCQRPGAPRTPWTGPLPGLGFPCPGPGCLHRRLEDGTVLFWDTKETLTARCTAAGVPCIIFREDWERLPEGN